MARPVIVSDLGARPEVVLFHLWWRRTDRMTGLRFSAGHDAALASALILIRLFTFPEAARRTIGVRGREWMLGYYGSEAVEATTLQLYAEVARLRNAV